MSGAEMTSFEEARMQTYEPNAYASGEVGTTRAYYWPIDRKACHIVSRQVSLVSRTSTTLTSRPF